MARIKHGLLTPNEVSEVTIDGSPGVIEVMNVNGAGEIYFRGDGVNPTAAGDDCHIVPAALGAALAVDLGSSTVRLLSEAATSYCVRGV